MPEQVPTGSDDVPAADQAAGSGRLAAIVAERVATGELKDDSAQTPAIAALDGLLKILAAPALGNKKSALGWMFGKKPKVSDKAPRGIYLWGGVGRGKSMLMDLFFDLAPTQPKRRVHFHDFMQDVHRRIHHWRQNQETAKERSADPIPPLADALAKEASLLCFDEFAVTDVADAMLLARLFTGLFSHGVTVVATSNVAPDLLYKNGLNRSFFLPFIELVKTRMQVLELVSDTDHRLAKLVNGDVYLTGSGSMADFEQIWTGITDGLVVAPATIEVAGRVTQFDRATGGVVRACFADLCEKPLGAGDYLALAARFHTLFLDHVPVMDYSDRNAAKRFIALIDTLYDKKRVLIMEAAAHPTELYRARHGTEAFEFDRTASRLQEMQSSEWLTVAGKNTL